MLKLTNEEIKEQISIYRETLTNPENRFDPDLVKQTLDKIQELILKLE